jgi:SWI/SNF-related matrix-associated actin-dependent regulator of chromatin subfamily A member 2/4
LQQIQSQNHQQQQLSAIPMAAYRQVNKIAPVQKPSGLDPHELLKERENFINQKIRYRISELERLPIKQVNDDLRLKISIELKALRLLEFQKQVRQEIVSCMRADTTLETSLNPKAYKRCKRQTLREARVTEKMERQQKQEAERKKRQKHLEYLNAIIEHSKNFKDVHRSNVSRVGKMAKAVINWHTNTERIQKKEQERLEKERIKLLMAEDEEGYRKLVNEKKDKRLAYLLGQTDEYIDSLTKLVQDHQNDICLQKSQQAKRSNKNKNKSADVSLEQGKEGNEEEDEDRHVKVTKISTGEVLEGAQAPKASELDAWLEAHPGWEVVPRELDDEDEDSNSNNAPGVVAAVAVNDAEAKTESGEAAKTSDENPVTLQQIEDDEYNQSNQGSYYGVAHKVREKVTEQASILVGGQLKPYQIRVKFILYIFFLSL